MNNNVSGTNSAPPSQVRGRNKGRNLFPGDADRVIGEVEQIVARINGRLQAKTVESIMQIGEDLVRLSGYGTGRTRMRGLMRHCPSYTPRSSDSVCMQMPDAELGWSQNNG